MGHVRKIYTHTHTHKERKKNTKTKTKNISTPSKKSLPLCKTYKHCYQLKKGCTLISHICFSRSVNTEQIGRENGPDHLNVYLCVCMCVCMHTQASFPPSSSKLLNFHILNMSLMKLHCFWKSFKRLFFFFLTSLLEYNCFTMVCQFLLYKKVNQLYVYTYPHIPFLLHLPPTLPIRPLQVVTEHQADLPVLNGCFPLAIYFTFGSVYICPCHSFILSQLTLPPPLILKSILQQVCVFIPILPLGSS